MSRSKKSRKPGGAPTAKPKLSKQELATVEKRVRQKKGKQAGNRQKEALQSNESTDKQSVNKDPRLGNKTPIALGKITAKVEAKKSEVKQEPRIAAVHIAEQTDKQAEILAPVLSIEQEIDAIEQDEKLQDILTKQEDDIALTEDEVDYYNDLMDRHEQLSAEIDEDDSEENEEESDSDSEDDLWDKLDRSIDNSDFSDFDEK
jgi:ribosome assembly protein YihI (activator of Der GTPase)